MLKFVFLIFILTLFGCKSRKEVQQESLQQETEVIQETEEKPKRPQQIISRIGKFPESSPITIDTAIVRGNILQLSVQYTGGCKYHRFEFIGDPALMKSLPPKRSVKLVHYNDQDQCESVVLEQIEVDLKELSVTETTGSEIILILEGYNHPIQYVYP